MKTKRQTYEIVSEIAGHITGKLTLCNETKAQAKKWAREHSRCWNVKTVFVYSNTFLLYAFARGREIVPNLKEWSQWGHEDGGDDSTHISGDSN